MDVPPIARHEVAHLLQAARGLALNEAQADAFAAGKKSATRALRG